MELLRRRKAFSSISRYRLRRRSNVSSLEPFKASANLGESPSPSFSTPLHSERKLFCAMQSWSWRYPGIHRTLDTNTEIQQSNPFCYNLIRPFSDWGCASGALHILARNCTSTAYAPPAPPQAFRNGDQEAEADDGATLNVDDPQGMAAMEGADDLNMPPFDDADYPEYDEEFEAEEPPPPDPEEKLLYSPSDED